MNKETRQFILGIIFTLICGLGVSIHISAIINKTWTGGVNYFLLLMSLIGLLQGIYLINKTT